MSAGSVSVPIIIPLKAPGSSTIGSRKWMIDTDTHIEIHSDTKNCVLFYTLNGTKPDPFKKIGDRTTYQYNKPFTLKPGKCTVKAIAVLKDGSKESSANTKVFEVELSAPKSDNEENGLLNSTWESQVNERKLSKDEKTQRTMFKKVIRYPDEKKQLHKTPQSLVQKILTDSPSIDYVDHSRTDRNYFEDALRCLRCNTTRPDDPYARFCSGCSGILPPAPGRIRSSPVPNYPKTFPCDQCGTMIPHDAMYCSACDANVSVKNREYTLKGNICRNCGSKNQTNAKECVVCDEKLMNTLAKKEAPHPSSEFLLCPFCTRVNASDARFCDWCGKTPSPASSTTPCQRCYAENTLSAKYCCSCGKVMLAPARKQFQETLEQGHVAVKTDSGTTMELMQSLTDADRMWKKVPLQPSSKRRIRNAATQVGDDSTVDFGKLSLKSSNKLSPGKGYWRQQIEHINQNVKIFAQNNLEFRESMSKHVISGLIAVDVEEKTDDSEMTIHATFNIRTDSKIKKKSKNDFQGGQTLINALSTTSKIKNGKFSSGSRPSSASSRPSSGRSRPVSANNSRPTSASSRPGSGRKKKKVTQKMIEKEKIAAKLSKLSPESLKLLNMIKSSKTLDLERLQELLDSEDVDLNLKDENNFPLLKLSVTNKRFDILQLLISAGVLLDEISGVKETTALHEAVSQGIQGKEAVEILLENGASPDIKDKKGLTPYDHALELGSDALISKFTKHSTDDLLKDVLKI